MRDPQPEKAICEAVTLVRMRLLARDRSRFFGQIGHQDTYDIFEILKHFFL